MLLDEFKKKIKFPLRQANLVFLVRGDQVLLAMKKRGFGEGKWNGVGGKPNKSETIYEAALRETQEEINVEVKKLEQVATLDFYFLDEPVSKGWNQQVVVYLAREWVGEPSESEEMKPKWFRVSELPLDDMWSDDKHWLPIILAGKKLEAEFAFDTSGEVAESSIC